MPIRALSRMASGSPRLVDKFLKGGIATRLGAGAGYVAGGYALGAVFEHKAGEARAYYGDREFERRYGDQFSRAQGLARTAGIVSGIAAFLGKGPIGLATTPLRDAAAISRQIYFGGVTALRGMGLSRSLPMVSRARTGIRAERGAMAAGVVSSSMERQARVLDRFGTAKRRFRESKEQYMMQKKIAKGARGRALIGATLLGGYTLSESVGGGTLAYAPLALGAAAIGLPMAKYTARHPMAMGGMAGAATAGVMFGTKTPQYAAAESGNITYRLRDTEQSAVSKMSFTTSGLVQALHHNRRID